MYTPHWKITLAGILALLFTPIISAAADTRPGIEIREDLSKTMAVEKKTQDVKENWSEQSKDMTDKLERLTREAADLEKNLEKLDRRLVLEEKRLAENLRREKETARVKAELGVFLDSVLERLDSAIASDLPFLMEERLARLSSLKNMMVDPAPSSAEKFRRIFEALQIEAEYGTTVEVTQETIPLGDAEVLADIFRLGRVSLFCQTIDGKRSGTYDPVRQKWLVLPPDTNRDISKAIAMARLERSIELVKLPLGRIVVQ
ncbi:MAG: DUF3450 domain-containing protein [Desulfobacter sp.]